jgi:hypothetical protein
MNESPCCGDPRWRWKLRFMPWLLYSHGKSPLYPLYKKVNGPQIILDAAAYTSYTNFFFIEILGNPELYYN